MSRVRAISSRRERFADRDGAFACACLRPDLSAQQGFAAQCGAECPAGRRLHPGRFRSATRCGAGAARHPLELRLPLHPGIRLARAQPRRPRRHPGACQHAGGSARNVIASSAAPVTAITPSSYNLGVSLGWRRFAISGDVAQTEGGVVPGRREAAEVGMSYRANRRLTGRVAVAAERAEGAQRLLRRRRGLFARCRRRLLDRPQRRCHRRRPLPHRSRPARADVARRAPRQPGGLRRNRLPLLTPGVDSRPAVRTERRELARFLRIHPSERDHRQSRPSRQLRKAGRPQGVARPDDCVWHEAATGKAGKRRRARRRGFRFRSWTGALRKPKPRPRPWLPSAPQARACAVWPGEQQQAGVGAGRSPCTLSNKARRSGSGRL